MSFGTGGAYYIYQRSLYKGITLPGGDVLPIQPGASAPGSLVPCGGFSPGLIQSIEYSRFSSAAEKGNGMNPWADSDQVPGGFYWAVFQMHARTDNAADGGTPGFFLLGPGMRNVPNGKAPSVGVPIPNAGLPAGAVLIGNVIGTSQNGTVPHGTPINYPVIVPPGYFIRACPGILANGSQLTNTVYFAVAFALLALGTPIPAL